MRQTATPGCIQSRMNGKGAVCASSTTPPTSATNNHGISGSPGWHLVRLTRRPDGHRQVPRDRYTRTATVSVCSCERAVLHVGRMIRCRTDGFVRSKHVDSTRKVSSAASDELRQYRRARRSRATERHDSSPGPDLPAGRGGSGMSLCFEISLNSAPPVVAGGDSLAVVTAMAVMRWDGAAPELELQVGGLATAPGRQRWSWMERALGVGDRITITVVQSGSPTAPDR